VWVGDAWKEQKPSRYYVRVRPTSVRMEANARIRRGRCGSAQTLCGNAKGYSCRAECF